MVYSSVQLVNVVKFKVGIIIYAVGKQKREKSIRNFGMASSCGATRMRVCLTRLYGLSKIHGFELCS